MDNGGYNVHPVAGPLSLPDPFTNNVVTINSADVNSIRKEYDPAWG